jgi:hypothetical protein
VVWIGAIFTHTELIGTPDILWLLPTDAPAAAPAARGLRKKMRGEGAPKLRGRRSLAGSCSAVGTLCRLPGSAVTADVGDRNASQGDGMDDKNKDERRNGSGGGDEAAEMERGLVAASLAGIYLPIL